MTTPIGSLLPAKRRPTVVKLVSGKETTVQTTDEAAWFTETRDLYTRQLKFTDQTDLMDLDRLLVLELMVFRWTQQLSKGEDYDGEMLNEKQMVQDLKLYCVDEDTEMLTEHGWARYDEVVPGEAIYTYNTDTGLAEWQVPEKMNFGSGHKMLRLESRNHSSLTTPGHSWPVLQGSGQRRTPQWRTSETLNTASWLMTAVDPAPVVATENDAFVELVGWYWTEGSLTEINGRPAQGTVTQSWRVNPQHCASIRLCLTALYGDPGPMGSVRGTRRAPYWMEDRKDSGITVFRLSVQIVEDLQRAAPGKVKALAPTWLRRLSLTQLRTLLTVSVDADGWVTGKGAIRLCQSDLQRVRGFEMACALAGVPTSTKRRSVGDWEIGLLGSRVTAPWLAASMGKGAVAEYVDYEGIFWCPTVENGTWLARRNGTVAWTGNSDQINKVKESMGLTKKQRDASSQDGNFASWFADTLSRAKLFGMHRQNQLNQMLSLGKELFFIVETYDRSDAEEKQKFGFQSEGDIVEWIRHRMKPEFDALDEYFREHEQRLWIRDL